MSLQYIHEWESEKKNWGKTPQWDSFLLLLRHLPLASQEIQTCTQNKHSLRRLMINFGFSTTFEIQIKRLLLDNGPILCIIKDHAAQMTNEIRRYICMQVYAGTIWTLDASSEEKSRMLSDSRLFAFSLVASPQSSMTRCDVAAVAEEISFYYYSWPNSNLFASHRRWYAWPMQIPHYGL